LQEAPKKRVLLHSEGITLSRSILIVDDDPEVVEILSESLKGKGYRVETAFDGSSAISKYESYRPDLVILDVLLPDRDGFSVCSEIKNSDETGETPVIMISSDYVPESVMKGLNAGAQDYIRKPFSLDEILLKIEKCLSQASRKRDLVVKNLMLRDELQKGQEDYMRVNRELRKKILDMRSLFELTQDLNRLRDPEEVVRVFSLTVIGQLGVGSVALFYVDGDSEDVLSYFGGNGVSEVVLKPVTLSRKNALARFLMANPEAVSLENGGLPHDVKIEAEFMARFGFDYCYPLIVKSKLFGIVFIGNKVNDQPLTENDIELFKWICTSAATGLENARLYSQLQATYLSTIKVLVSTIEAKDSYTRGHTERVAEYATMIAEEMNLPKKDRETISFGAALHDIGKLGVYEDILNKPGELDEKEWEVVRNHPVVGANIIKDMKFLEAASDLVRHHHERLNGSGYPDGLKGDEISLGARIVAVADSFDAMTSDRPYRKGYSLEKAIELLKQQSDKFDQNVVEHLERLVKSGRIRR